MKKVENKEFDIFNYLISNKGFIDWVRNPNETSDYFWNKWIEEKSNHNQDIMKAREFVEKLQFRDEKLTEEELNNFLRTIIKKENPTHLNWKHNLWPFTANFNMAFKYASVFLVFLATTFFMYHFSIIPHKDGLEIAKVEWEVVSNPRGKKAKVTLPDGTIVDLNYESTLKYPKKFNDSIRQVELTGEAFFDVSHMDDCPFIVKTGAVETQVFGTSFNINSFDQNHKVEVSLVTGKVKIKKTNEATRKSNYVELVPGEQLVYNKVSQELVKNEFDIKNITAWKDGFIIFENVGFKEFIDRLERWYGINFQIYGNPPQNWKFNGSYQNENIENILIGVKFVYNLDYYIKNNNITIKFK